MRGLKRCHCSGIQEPRFEVDSGPMMKGGTPLEWVDCLGRAHP